MAQVKTENEEILKVVQEERQALTEEMANGIWIFHAKESRVGRRVGTTIHGRHWEISALNPKRSHQNASNKNGNRGLLTSIQEEAPLIQKQKEQELTTEYNRRWEKEERTAEEENLSKYEIEAEMKQKETLELTTKNVWETYKSLYKTISGQQDHSSDRRPHTIW